MSDHFDIYCRTCEVAGNVFRVNGGGKWITQIVQDLLTLRDLAWVVGRLTSGLGLGPGSSAYGQDISDITPELLAFATAHAGHDVAARSEYGGFYDRCSKWWRCGNCQSNHSCLKTVGHIEPCGPVAKAP